jgi:LacI family transcriptional regulator
VIHGEEKQDHISAFDVSGEVNVRRLLVTDDQNLNPITDVTNSEIKKARGSGKPTINDIARIADVSKKTVSRVINQSPFVKPETRAHVQKVIAEIGFVPDPQARALALRKSFLVGLVYDNPSPQYVVNMQRGILDALEGTDYQLVLRPCDRLEPHYLARVESFIQQHRPFGLILPPSVSEDDAIVQLLRDQNIDYVRIACVELDDPNHLIQSEDFEGGVQAAQHLTELGHRNIAHIHGPLTFRSTHERRRGFEHGLKVAGISLRSEFCVEGGYTFESGVTAGAKLLSGADRPTAIFAGNDEMATGAYVAMRKAGLSLPDDMSIVGYDDTPISGRLWPALTTVRLPIREMGRAAAQLLIDVSQGKTMSARATFSPELIVRDSTRRASSP